MQKIMVMSMLILATMACKKSTTTVAAPDTFIFGTDGGFCQQCYKAYMIKGGRIFKDSVYGLPGIFRKVALADSEYQLAKPLIDAMPKYLLQHPNITTGCGGCADEAVIHIFYITGTDTLFWNIDTQNSSLPADVNKYVTQVQNDLEILN